MLAEITAALSGLQAAGNLLQGLNAANAQARINDVKITLQNQIFQAQSALTTAQQSQSALTTRINDLEQEIVRMKNWESEKQNYELKSISTGAFAYMRKAGMESGQPLHWLCANCFDHGNRSILQNQGRAADKQYSIYGCHHCSSKIQVFWRRSPEKMTDDQSA